MPSKPMNNGELLKEIHESVTQVKTVLLGVPGTQNGGLVQRVDEVCNSHYKLKRQFYILIGVLIGSGVLGINLWKVFGG